MCTLSKIIQIALICLGWYVVHYFSSKRDLDKIKREMLLKESDSLSDIVDLIFNLAVEYHTSDLSNFSDESTLKIRLQDLSHRLSLLNKTTSEAPIINCAAKEFILFKRAITERNFEDEHSKLSNNSEQIQDIAASAVSLKHMILSFKHSQIN